MGARWRRTAGVLTGVAFVAGIAFAAVGSATSGDDHRLTPVPSANTRSDGYAPSSKLSPELQQILVAQGADGVENPTSAIGYYGYDNDILNAAGQPQMVPTPTSPANEAHKTEPDKNTYLVFERGLKGADPNYRYGTHFLFQGHEGGSPGYITRINLDADAAHRVTLLPTVDTNGVPLSTIDGSTWDPWAQALLFTTEVPAAAGVYSAKPDYPTTVDDLSGSFGRGGYEGIQNDSDGNLWIAEDVGGANKTDASGASTTARRPNSFIFRFVPKHPGDLKNGKLQALQVLNSSGNPITFESQAALNNPHQVALHSYGNSFKTRWVTLHDTAVDGTQPFAANALAKAAHATPFKRPENGVFRPGSNFREFYFDETGDTNATSPENDTAGGWGAIQKLSQSKPSSDTGTLTLFYKPDGPHSSLDNVTFLSRNEITFVQDMGDTLHRQLNALDSGFVWDVTRDYSKPSNQPVRWIAEGRDPSATIDAANSGFGKNDGDNELTGVYVSDGDTGRDGILGAKTPNLDGKKWRWFSTQQHGDNLTYEVILSDDFHDGYFDGHDHD